MIIDIADLIPQRRNMRFFPHRQQIFAVFSLALRQPVSGGCTGGQEGARQALQSAPPRSCNLWRRPVCQALQFLDAKPGLVAADEEHEAARSTVRLREHRFIDLGGGTRRRLVEHDNRRAASSWKRRRPAAPPATLRQFAEVTTGGRGDHRRFASSGEPQKRPWPCWPTRGPPLSRGNVGGLSRRRPS